MDSREYCQKFRRLVQLERDEEIRVHEQEMKRLSGREREKKGRAVLDLKGRYQGQALGNRYLVKFVRPGKERSLPDTEISIGDLVLLSRGSLFSKANPSGTVTAKTGFSVTVSFDKYPPKFILSKGVRMDLFVNDITFQRMLEALSRFRDSKGRLTELKEKILGDKRPEFFDADEPECYNRDLNPSQNNGVRRALSAKDFFLIHGPPGTGKTLTCIEILMQAKDRFSTVMACADSNTAVDNIVERLAGNGVNAVRVGNPVRVTESLREHTLDFMLESHPDYIKASELRGEISVLMEKQGEYTFPDQRWRRGMSNEKILALAEEGKGFRGVPGNKVQSMANWIEIRQEIDNLFEKVNEYEERAVSQLLSGADVVCCTNSTAGSDVLKEREIDFLVVDEATQCTQPSALIPLVNADRFVLAGDHKQLPPTVLNREAETSGLAESLFEFLLDVHGTEIKEMLDVQYRMNTDIMDFSSEEFYDRGIKADDSVASRVLKDIIPDLKPFGGLETQVLAGPEPMVFIDTASKGSSEGSYGDSKSYFNSFEADWVGRILKRLCDSGFPMNEAAVITPYKDQADLLKRECDYKGLEIDSVDGFQGREKEVVILSLVRSNPDKNTGFLKDLRRLNVSVT
ncbi:MAG: IGHMBP2 family helicase, partial [Chitinivibrionales bacterium]